MCVVFDDIVCLRFIVGVEDSEDRKKLYFLIQRLQSVRKATQHTLLLLYNYLPLVLLSVEVKFGFVICHVS